MTRIYGDVCASAPPPDDAAVERSKKSAGSTVMPTFFPASMIGCCHFAGISPFWRHFDTDAWRMPKAPANFCCVPNRLMMRSTYVSRFDIGAYIRPKGILFNAFRLVDFTTHRATLRQLSQGS